jgi:hypothetical protein
MTQEFKTKGTFTKSARIVSDYKNDMIFEQPRKGLIRQELVTYENTDNGSIRKIVTTRAFTSIGGYDDTESVTILQNRI